MKKKENPSGIKFWHSHCAVCTVIVHQSLVESILEKGFRNNRSFLGVSACQLQAVEQVFFFSDRISFFSPCCNETEFLQHDFWLLDHNLVTMGSILLSFFSSPVAIPIYFTLIKQSVEPNQKAMRLAEMSSPIRMLQYHIPPCDNRAWISLNWPNLINNKNDYNFHMFKCAQSENYALICAMSFDRCFGESISVRIDNVYAISYSRFLSSSLPEPGSEIQTTCWIVPAGTVRELGEFLKVIILRSGGSLQSEYARVDIDSVVDEYCLFCGVGSSLRNNSPFYIEEGLRCTQRELCKVSEESVGFSGVLPVTMRQVSSSVLEAHKCFAVCIEHCLINLGSIIMWYNLVLFNLSTRSCYHMFRVHSALFDFYFSTFFTHNTELIINALQIDIRLLIHYVTIIYVKVKNICYLRIIFFSTIIIDLDILFLCYDHIENVDEILASDPPSISQSKSIITAQLILTPQSQKLKKTNTTLPKNKNLLANQTFAYNLGLDELVVSGSLKLPPTNTQTRAWKDNQVSSASQSSFLPPQKMSHSHCHSPPSLSSNMPRILKTLCPQLESCHHNLQPYFMNHNLLHIVTLIYPLGYSSNHCDCIIDKCFFILERALVELRRISTELKTKFIKIRLKLCKNSTKTTGIISVYVQVKRKELHSSEMETALVRVLQVLNSLKRELRKATSVILFINWMELYKIIKKYGFLYIYKDASAALKGSYKAVPVGLLCAKYIKLNLRISQLLYHMVYLKQQFILKTHYLSYQLSKKSSSFSHENHPIAYIMKANSMNYQFKMIKIYFGKINCTKLMEIYNVVF
ncbi:hypothetical protein VP01_1056g1 [Puccinia sorghi]|uniref:Uncharacterized protein n=1 Tax=Puccinia sorghi TaxID=27349 RepID=A0A0L6VU39_9BASI|nr:hypothetical protein VP01_1056g1 [Puccinia sorghi]